MNEPIMPSQMAVIKERVIWLMIGQPSDAFVKWWEMQKPVEIEERIKKMNKEEATKLIEKTLLGNWSDVLDMMREVMRPKE